MRAFEYSKDILHCESTSLLDIASKFGTPSYVYSSRTIDEQCERMREAFRQHPTLACFAVKANSTRAILTRIFSHGFGADIVSGGELERALRAGAPPEKIVFSGVGKQDWEIELALQKEIGAFNVEGADELPRIEALAQRLGKNPNVFLRINPNIAVDTNPYIATGLYSTKFGIAEDALGDALTTLQRCPSLCLVGLSAHLGSQITDLATFKHAAQRLVQKISSLRSTFPKIDRLNLGGGLAIHYYQEKAPAVEDYANMILPFAKQAGLQLVLEPGRWIVAESGGLLCRVIAVKSTPEKNFAIVDAGMNDLIRPALYGAHHPVIPIQPRPGPAVRYDVVGPVCETGDFLALDRPLPPLAAGDLILVGVAGAYGFTLSSNYNSRPRPPEIWVEERRSRLIRQRENLDALWALEL